ncbi:MAG: type VI secretion system tip protein VgrG [Bacteroidetes bacterium]|nr:MAG: type VI secretion system tip protein VgrG [Bacteroidota bacterium]
MAQSPLTEKANLLSFRILVEGNEISGSYHDQVIEIRTEQDINQVGEAEIILRDGNPAKQDFPISDSDTFKPGNKIEIQMGYEGSNETVFKGMVLRMLLQVGDADGSRLKIHCREDSMKMTINRKNAIFLDQTDSSIMEQIASDYSLSASVDSTSLTHKKMVQFYASDWDFVLKRAAANGLVVYMDSGELKVTKPQVSESPELLLTYGKDIREFDCELDATYQYSGVEAKSWSIENQALISATGESPGLNSQGNISSDSLSEALGVGTINRDSNAFLEQEGIQAWANASWLRSGLSRFQGTISFQGSSLAKLNSLIQLEDLSERFNGNAYISGVYQQIDHQGWTTEVRIGLSPEWMEESGAPEAKASGLLPGVNGLQTGIVKKIDEDPDGEFRVQVEIPILGAEGSAVWARLATFYTGNSIGAYFMPELNDEVVLGFMNDDPRYPIILGSVYSKSIAAPETPDADNTIKTIITSSKLQLKFDDQNKVITLLTPGGNQAVLSDQDKGITLTDQNQNKITMNDQGITIDSQSAINIKATDSIKMNAPTIELTGTESIKESAPSISLSGDESVSVTGSGSCSVSSDGETSIKGSAVMIN